MRVLFDHGTPAPLRHALLTHTVTTAYELGWARLNNGDLLTEAEAAGFELLLTTDQQLRYQQNLSDRKIAIFLLPVASWPRLRPYASSLAQAVSAVPPGAYIEWQFPE